MKLEIFGGANSDHYNIDIIIGWLEALIEDEAELCESIKSEHRLARLDRAYDALRALNEVSKWNPKLTKHFSKHKKP